MKFNNWSISHKNGTITYQPFQYEIDAKDLFRDGVGDWIGHLSGKNWFSPEEKENFLKAVQYYKQFN